MDYQTRIAISEGEQAKTILNNPIFEKVVSEYQNRLINRWKDSKITNSLERENIWLEYKTLNTIVEELNIIMLNGNAAERISENEQEQS